ncbi:MAG TPA: glycosyltransferase family 2 protein [Patescibacteria group bacterium]
MKNKPDLTIIILTYNSKFWLKKTLETLKEHYLTQAERDVKVVVVDNNSSDDTLTMVHRSFRWVHTIELTSNNGFSAGNNVALRQVDSKYVMLLNSDVEFLDKVSNLDVLLDYMDAHPKVGVITPRLEFANGELDQASHRGEPDLWASFTYFSGLESLFPRTKVFGQYHQFYKNLSVAHQIDACSGAAMIVRVSAMKKVGYLDEQFFMYAEDLDWCKRFREAGFTIVFNPEVTLIHHKNKSGLHSATKQIARETKRHFYDTMLQYYDKHYAARYPQWVRNSIKYLLFFKKGV